MLPVEPKLMGSTREVRLDDEDDPLRSQNRCALGRREVFGTLSGGD